MNLSKRKLSPYERNALKFGLNHPTLPKKVDKDKIKSSIEKLVYALSRKTGINLEGMKDDIKFLLRKFIHTYIHIYLRETIHNTTQKKNSIYGI